MQQSRINLVRALKRWARSLEKLGRVAEPLLREEFSALQFSGQALQKLLDDYPFHTVLDIGSGEGHHSDIFINHGKMVTALDYGKSVYFERRKNISQLEAIVADFNTTEFNNQFDCVWCSHVLEHQLDPHAFLRRVHGLIKEGGILALTVPPIKQEIVGGHVSLWNAGLLLYRLVLAGFDCSSARILRYGYNISIILQKRSVDVLNLIAYDSGDIRRLKHLLPTNLAYHPNEVDDPFDGDIYELNWVAPTQGQDGS